MSQYAVDVQNFSFWYGQFQAIKDLNFGINANEISALIGPSGCGKSTLLKCFNRITERNPQVSHKGTIKVFDQDIYDAQVALPELRKKVGMVFQKPNPLPLTVKENVLFGVNVHEDHLPKFEHDEILFRALSKVRLWEKLKDRLDDPALGLSLELQQRLCIARLLPLKPSLILMDEPCSALDPAGIEAVENLLKELKKEYTIIIVTHSMAQAKRVSDKTLFMYMGELVEMGETQKVFNNPDQEKTRFYIEGRFG
ncbi:MAG: phosphate ABC transporter ATP-binding protein [Bacteriovoracaceae bacterium]|nr:phosphate ABC transporter ATP-binding protein [Bacteriovoracaceae bacterium]